MLDRRFRGKPRVASSQVFGHLGIQLRETLDVQLVDDGLVPGRARRPVVAPGERRVDYRRQGRKGALSRSSKDRSAAGSLNL